MTSKHTPGPWLTVEGLVYALDETGRVNRFSAMITAGFVTYRGERTNTDELRANVRLIAAAPDMLAALRLAEGQLALLLRQYPDQSETCDHPTATRYVLDKVTAAIAKATEPTT